MKQAHQTFIIEMIKHGDKTLAYQKAYPKCTDEESARKSAERLLRHHPEIAGEIEEAAAHIRQQAYTDAYLLHTEQQKTKLLSMMDKREILARIAKCEIKVCRYIKDGDRYRMLFEDPHPREIIRAVEADTRIEDICNRARNLTDSKLSQFNIYIDGRPCDDPAAPVNPDIPPGIFMLPGTRKKLTQEQGNKPEHSYLEETHYTSPPPGDLGVQPAQEKTPTEEQGNKTEQNTKKGSFPACPDNFGVFREGGTNEESDGRVDSRRSLAQEKILTEEQGIISEQNTETGLPLRLSDSAVKHSNTTQQLPTHYTSPLSGDLGVKEPQDYSPLYPQYLALYQKRKLQAEDLLAASFYQQEKRAIASVPPPHILTEEEVRQLHAEADTKKEQNKKRPQQPYNSNTFGKMYFPSERR